MNRASKSVTPKIDLEREPAEKHKIAVAIALSAVLIGTAIVVASIVGG